MFASRSGIRKRFDRWVSCTINDGKVRNHAEVWLLTMNYLKLPANSYNKQKCAVGWEL